MRQGAAVKDDLVESLKRRLSVIPAKPGSGPGQAPESIPLVAESDKLSDVFHFFQIPDRFYQPVHFGFRQNKGRKGAEFAFQLLIRRRIPRIPFGDVHISRIFLAAPGCNRDPGFRIFKPGNDAGLYFFAEGHHLGVKNPPVGEHIFSSGTFSERQSGAVVSAEFSGQPGFGLYLPG